jgi:glyoxylase-like metal-dependent hydrolase (beta-lactamase superfamily II)
VPSQVFQVSDSIWCARQPSYLTCSYGVRTPTGVVLVDAGMDSSGKDVQKLLNAMQATKEEVRALLITHWHNDHAAGGQWTQAQTGCRVYYDIAEKPWLSRETAHEGWRGWLSRHIPEWGIGVLFIGLLGEAVPNAVGASDYVEDGQVLLDDFEVISTPGHTVGHTSFYYRPEQALFAGDALAVIGDDVRFMARPVTLDLAAARASMEKCLRWEVSALCPGHRMPLTKDVAQSCERMRDYLATSGRWPLFG